MDYSKNKQVSAHQSPQLNTDQIAEVVAKAVGTIIENNLKNIHIPLYNIDGSYGKPIDSYDNSASLEKLAESMLVQRGKNESNFDNLGNVNTSKKDVKETKETIDLLANLED